jgi:hypothetical protein
MPVLVRAVTCVALSFVAGLAASVATRLFVGGINTVRKSATAKKRVA